MAIASLLMAIASLLMAIARLLNGYSHFVEIIVSLICHIVIFDGPTVGTLAIASLLMVVARLFKDFC